MTNLLVAQRRLRSQRLTGPPPGSTVRAVRWFGAVQAQVVGSAKWAVGMRAGVPETAVDEVLTDGRILRLHLMRPTWHFVAADDVRWLLALTAGRVHKANATRYRQLGIDHTIRSRCYTVLQERLTGGRQLTRAGMEETLNQAGIPTDLPQRLVYLLMSAELDGLICSGAWAGKQATYALLDERVPHRPLPDREESLAELAVRFFASHGPATIKDFSWWSGLTMGESREAVDLAQSALQEERIGDQSMWSQPVDTVPQAGPPLVHLLPAFDEYTVAYANRDAVFDPQYARLLHMRGGILDPVFLINGLVAGGWQRAATSRIVRIIATPLWKLSPEEEVSLANAAEQYGEYLGLPIDLHIHTPSGESKNL